MIEIIMTVVIDCKVIRKKNLSYFFFNPLDHICVFSWYKIEDAQFTENRIIELQCIVISLRFDVIINSMDAEAATQEAYDFRA